MEKSDRIAYEKPELLDYRYWGVVSGDAQTISNPGDVDPGYDPKTCDTGFEDS